MLLVNNLVFFFPLEFLFHLLVEIEKRDENYMYILYIHIYLKNATKIGSVDSPKLSVLTKHIRRLRLSSQRKSNRNIKLPTDFN